MLAVAALPKWVTDEHAITLATWALVVVTFLLVIATFVLWYDSWKKGNEQRERWKREDEQRAKDRSEERARWEREDQIRREALVAVYRFGLELNEASYRISLWCANLGFSTFQVDQIYAAAVAKIGAEPPPTVSSSPQAIVRSGERVDIRLPLETFEGVQGRVDFEFRIRIVSGTTNILSEPLVESLFAANKGVIFKIEDGFRELRPVVCEKCGATGLFDPNGLASRLELLRKLKEARKEISDSCPGHSSTLLRSTNEGGKTRNIMES